jgi:hypothetical protein
MMSDNEIPTLIQDDEMPPLTEPKGMKEWVTTELAFKNPVICYVGDTPDALGASWWSRPATSKAGVSANLFFISCRTRVSREFILGVVFPLLMELGSMLFVCERFGNQEVHDCNGTCVFSEIESVVDMTEFANKPNVTENGWPPSVIIMTETLE